MIKKKCRICKNKLLKIISLKKVALSGTFLKKNQIQKEKKYPISLTVCKNCKHVQIDNIINPKKLYSHYDWETAVSKSNVNLIKNLITKLNKSFGLKKNSKVFEIASNDGTLLKEVKNQYKSYVLGIDPAKNLKNISNKKDVATISDFFSYDKSQEIKKRYSNFDFCIARNVIAHTANPNDIFRGVKNILRHKGIFVIEVPHLLNIYKDNQYDNIFHEHIGFHSLKSLQDLCKKNFLKIIDVDIIKSQGGSLRCFISSKNSKIKVKKSINIILKKENRERLFNLKTWQNFSKKIKDHKNNLSNFLKNLKLKKYTISAYGASGKGQALLQFCGIDKKYIDFIYDKSKFKQGKYSPGTHIKIIDPKYINKNKPNYLLLLSWNIAKEIFKQEKKYLKHNGKMIVPFPNPHILK
jgi:SAM-dependent methyltransferase